VVCPHEPFLKLCVPWVKKLRNTVPFDCVYVAFLSEVEIRDHCYSYCFTTETGHGCNILLLNNVLGSDQCKNGIITVC
jgi:hypothetical protein